LGTGSWEHALGTLAIGFGVRSVNLALQWQDPGRASKVLAIGVDDTAIDSYERHYAYLNPLFPVVPRVPVGVPLTDAMVVRGT
jgi:hypothetical protein